ncbi:acid protease [Athelia psychrophila]|uniref:Acid protease n=1 Tax=Athelia psychrophila TaxID=1759441 RepID=A0A166F5Q9_9AGAM|nr:acid protease [Fibularhizoctonia sp. CBS 109695]
MFSVRLFLGLLIFAASFKGSIAVPAPRDLRATLALSNRFQTTGHGNIADADRARVRTLKSQGSFAKNHKRATSIPASNVAVTYTANVGVGNPVTNYTLLIDTGSSSTWIGAGKSYVQTSTSVSTGRNVSAAYGTGNYSGTEYFDTVTLSSGLVIRNQSIGVASIHNGFAGYDGILGIGPVDLNDELVSGTSTVPTVTDNLHAQGTISTEEIGVFFAPVLAFTSGEMTFGGVDSSKYTGPITYTPLTTTYPAAYYWGVNQSVAYNSVTILSSTAGIIDTGTTLVLLATEAYNAYLQATGAVLDSATGFLMITSAQYSALSDLDFIIGGTTLTLNPNAQIWPRSLNVLIGGSNSSIYLIINDLGSNSGEGLDFTNGYTFLERFYSVFDTTNSRVGFASTVYTAATIN